MPARFAVNVLWNWTGLAVTLASAVLLTPYMIAKLGDQGYGVWALAFALIEYYWLLDLGFRSATAKYTAHYHTLGDSLAVNQVVSTGFAYFAAIAALVLIATGTLAPLAPARFEMALRYQRDFYWLLVMFGASWASGALAMVFQAALEGLQRFDVINRVSAAVALLRVGGCFAVLYRGGGLLALGGVVAGAQLLNQALVVASCYLFYPQLRVSPRRVTRPMLKQMAGYGVHTVTATVAAQILNQSAPLLLGLFHPVDTVGYFNATNRIVQLSGGEVTGRVGLVSGAKSAELAARQDTGRILRLAVITNRYCLALFLLPSVFLLTYGAPLLALWLSPLWAERSGPILPVLILGTGLGVAAQFNSSAILYGLARHALYARGLLAEGITSLALLWLVVPRFELLGAAWITAALMILNRGLFLPWILCRALGTGWTRFMGQVLIRPLAGLAPALAAGWVLRRVLPGETWGQLLAAGVLLASLYGAIAFRVALEPEHRQWAAQWIRGRLTSLVR
jgi:O-antigen/teichoic acid export membrane protein